MYTGLDAVGVDQQVSTKHSTVQAFHIIWYYALDILALYLYSRMRKLRWIRLVALLLLLLLLLLS
jgi:heme A synthase